MTFTKHILSKLSQKTSVKIPSFIIMADYFLTDGFMIRFKQRSF